MLFVGTNVWAGETTTLLEYGTDNVAWTAAGLAKWTAGGTPTLADDKSYVSISGGNGSYETSMTISPTSKSIINVTAVWRGSSSTGRSFSSGNGSYFRFGNIVVAQNDQDKKHGYVFTGTGNLSSVTTFTAGSYRVDITSSTWLLIEAEIDTDKNKLTSFTIKSEDGKTTYASASNVALKDVDYKTVAFGYKKAGSVTTENAEQLKSIKITETTQDIVSVDYTINYIFGNETIKSVNGKESVENTVNAENPITIENVKYYATDNASTSFVIAESGNIFNVTLREAETWSYTVKSKGDIVTELVTGFGVEGENVTVPYPEFVLSNCILYKGDPTNKEYRTTFTMTENNKVSEINFTQNVENCVFYTEGEDIDGMSNCSGSNVAVRCSNAQAGTTGTDNPLTVTNLPAGKYIISVGVYENSKDANTTHTFTVGGDELSFTTEGVNQQTKTFEEITITKSTAVVYGGTENAKNGLDYIYIVRTGDAPVTSVTATIGEAGWATLYTGNALDFSGVEGLEAYTATVDGDNVVLTAVQDVPDFTGVILKGAPGEYEIPFTDASNTAKGSLEGNPESETSWDAYAANNGKLYILAAVNNGKDVQFVPCTSGSIAAGKAYLAVYNQGQAKAMKVVFASEATGISNVNVSVPVPVKRIQNGQLVIEKNGKAYNAAGQLK